MKDNLTFKRGEPIWSNACVGNNGDISYLTYAMGYSKSANLLIDTVLKKNPTEVDTFIYPICFNMRHSVELRLKDLIKDLKEFEKYRKKLPLFDLERSHDLGKIWSYIKKEIIKLDKRYEKFIQVLDSYIIDIAMVDSTGQIFRYPMSNENQKHLVEVNHINIHTLQKRFKELEKLLDELNYFNKVVLREYSCGTYTKNLSRLDILNLAKSLPLINEWRDKLDKKKLKNKFGISGRELSDAINIIKNHYEFGQFIGIKKNLLYTTIDDLVLFFDIWFENNLGAIKEKSTLGTSFQNDIDRFERYQKTENIFSSKYSLNEVLKKININSFIEIRELYYFNTNIENRLGTAYSELYIFNLEKQIKEKIYHYQNEFNNILGTQKAFENILASLYFLGQYEIADLLQKRYMKIYSLDIGYINNMIFFKKESILEYENEKKPT